MALNTVGHFFRLCFNTQHLHYQQINVAPLVVVSLTMSRTHESEFIFLEKLCYQHSYIVEYNLTIFLEVNC